MSRLQQGRAFPSILSLAVMLTHPAASLACGSLCAVVHQDNVTTDTTHAECAGSLHEAPGVRSPQHGSECHAAVAPLTTVAERRVWASPLGSPVEGADLVLPRVIVIGRERPAIPVPRHLPPRLLSLRV